MEKMHGRVRLALQTSFASDVHRPSQDEVIILKRHSSNTHYSKQKNLPEIFRLNKAHLSQLKMNFNQVHKEVSKDTLIMMVLVIVECTNLRLHRCASSSGKSTFSIYLVFAVCSI